MKSTAGYILALIGGILGIIGAIVTILMGIGVSFIPAGSFAVFGTGFFIGWGIWALIMSVIVLLGGLKMNKDDNSQVKTGGIMALVAGILGLNLLSIIGGIIGLIQAGK